MHFIDAISFSVDERPCVLCSQRTLPLFLGLLGLEELGFLVCGIVEAILSIRMLRLFFVIVALLTSSGTHLMIRFCLQQYSGFLVLNGSA